MRVIVWDLDDTLYDRHTQVGEDYSGVYDVTPYPGAISALTFKDQINILVTRERKDGVQDIKIDTLGIRDYFKDIYIVRKYKEKKRIFQDILDDYHIPVYIVGDNIGAEIRQGNMLGIPTVLIRRGKYSGLEPRDGYEVPDYEIKDLVDLDGVINRHVEIVFESHATTEDNENNISSGWHDVRLSKLGLVQARELGERHTDEHFDVIFCSDLRRSYMTGEIAFGDKFPIIQDERLRECNYGELNGHGEDEVKYQKSDRIRQPFPNGESYLQTTSRMKSFLDDLLRDYNHKRVMIIGHRATQYALEHLVLGKPLEEVVPAHWEWQPGWTYDLKSLN